MNNKTKIAIMLLSLPVLVACGSGDDTNTIKSNTTVTNPTPLVPVAPTPVTPVTPVTPTPVTPVTPTPVASNLAVNGDFDDWDAVTGAPVGWNIDVKGGITVAKETIITKPATEAATKASASSAAITVITGSQGDTDFRQSIDVEAGKTYTLSMSFYHTEGFIKARVYLDTYTDEYSAPDLVNEWQELSADYTATETKSIEIGARFYDEPSFDNSEIVYFDDVKFEESTGSTVTPTPVTPTPVTPTTPIVPVDTTTYYKNAEGKEGFALKTALYDIIKGHTAKTYGDLWTFMAANSLDKYSKYENDGSILDMYSENPSASDSYNYTPVTSQCGNYSGEGSCYNREHSFPKSWFNDASPMYTDIHHLFATDGYVNGKRSNYPYGEVGSATFTSTNGSKLGAAITTLGYTGTVFEPIDEFKGDFARAYFYMATRYQDIAGSWEANSDGANAVLDGSSDKVFENWVVVMLKRWSENDPVSQKEIDRNEAAYQFQGNRNPFINHPEYINKIWVD
jgi:endonuclease I